MEEVGPPQSKDLYLFVPSSTPRVSSIFSLSDSESEPELEPVYFDSGTYPIFQPDHDHLLHHHHRYQVNDVNCGSSQNALFTGPTTIGLGLDLGLPDPVINNNNSTSCNCNNNNKKKNNSDVDLELGLGLGFGNVVNDSETRRFEGGLRVVDINDDSDSDDDDEEEEGEGENRGGFGGVSDFDRPPYCWDYLGFSSGSRVESGEVVVDVGSVVNDNFDGFYDEHYCFGGEGDGERGGDREGVEDEDEDGSPIQLDTDVSNVFDTYQMRAEQQEIAIDSETDDGGEFGGGGGVDEAIRDLEWEILLAVNNFNREVYDMDFNVDMYEAILGEVEDRMNEWRGSPPAAEVVIENLPSVRVSSFEKDEVVCAICREDVSGEEVLKELPCAHHYHGECIVPWLKLRNTCPVCRHELPTDDEYEFQKREREMEEELNVDVNEDQPEDSQEYNHAKQD